MRTGWLAIVLTTFTAAPPAVAQMSRPYAVVRSGQPIVVASDVSVNPDCTSLGLTDVNLLVAPHGGNVMVGSQRGYVAYPPANPRAACNRRKLPATVITYRSFPGFVGPDTFVVEEVFPTGTAVKQRFTVTVR